MSPIFPLARAYFKIAIRHKTFFTVLAFGVLLLICSMAMKELVVGNQEKVIADLGIGAIWALNTLVVLILTLVLMGREEQGTYKIVGSKPVKPAHLLLGKQLGLTLVLTILTGTMAILLGLIYWWMGGEGIATLFLEAGFTLVEAVLFGACVLVLSHFTGPFLTVLLSCAIIVVGHSVTEARTLLEDGVSNAFSKGVVWLLYYVVPNFDHFDLTNIGPFGGTMSVGSVGWRLLYFATYCGLLLFGGSWLAERRAR